MVGVVRWLEGWMAGDLRKRWDRVLVILVITLVVLLMVLLRMGMVLD